MCSIWESRSNCLHASINTRSLADSNKKTFSTLCIAMPLLCISMFVQSLFLISVYVCVEKSVEKFSWLRINLSAICLDAKIVFLVILSSVLHSYSYKIPYDCLHSIWNVGQTNSESLSKHVYATFGWRTESKMGKYGECTLEFEYRSILIFLCLFPDLCALPSSNRIR